MPVSMLPRFSAFCLAALAVCGLLTACPKRSEFHLVLFNNTNDQIIFWRRAADPRPIVILACTGGNVTDLSTDGVMIQRNGTVYHYRYPAAYIYPSASVPPGYERKVQRIGKAFCLQLAPDNRIYLLERREAYTDFAHLAQPTGFPLEPTQTDAAPAPRKKEKSALPL